MFGIGSIDILEYLIRGLVLLTALPVHEAAHAFAAYKLGDHTGKWQGRLSLNPMRHLDLFGSVALILFGFGWAKPVQINARNFKNPKVGMAISAFAGPLSNLVMAFLALILYKVTLYTSFMTNIDLRALLTIFSIFVGVNLSLAVFNLLPIPPLDGSRIVTLFLDQRTYFKIMQYERYIFLGFIILIFSGILSVPLSYITGFFYEILDFLTRFVDIIFQNIAF